VAPAVVGVNDQTRELLIRALRAYRVHAAGQLPDQDAVMRALDDTVEDLITGRCRLLLATDEAWRQLGVSG
jgi:hypothetical protein